MQTKLILTDIDRTILPWGNKVVSQRTIDAFHAAQRADIVIGPASGRFHSWIGGFFDNDASCCSTAIASNGMQVFHEGKLICEKTISAQCLQATAEFLAEVPRSGLLCFEDGEPCLVAGSIDDLAVCFPRYAETCRKTRRVPKDGSIKANVFVVADLEGTKDLVTALNEKIDGADFDVPQPMFSNMMPTGWNKGAALDFLRDYLGVSPQELVVFGDAGNDLPLFSHAVHSVAVANATPEAAAAARWHIGSVDEDAVAQAIERLAAGEWPFVA